MTFITVKPENGRLTFPRFSNFVDSILENEFPAITHSDRFTTPVLVNTKETKEGYSIEVAAPGYSKENFRIKIEEQLLTISAEISTDKKEENEKYTRKEHNFSNFSRSFTLPKTVNTSKISAEYKDGILYVVVPVLEEVKEKAAIEVKVA